MIGSSSMRVRKNDTGQRKHETVKSPRREYPLSTLLELIGMPRSSYYYHEANPPSDRQAAERPAIVEICEKSQFR